MRHKITFMGTLIIVLALIESQTLAAPNQKTISSPTTQESIDGYTLLSTDPFGLVPEGKFQVLIIQKLPINASKKSSTQWLKDQNSLNRLNEILKQGVPLITGKIPEGTTAEAFVLPESYQLTQDVLKSEKITNHKNILFIQERATLDIIEHEFQHWTDYENGTFDQFMKELLTLSKSLKLSSSEIDVIQDALVEQRGYCKQQVSLLENSVINSDVLITEVSQNYSNYAERILPVILRLKKRNADAAKSFVKFLMKYELNQDCKIKFENIFRNFM